MHPKIGLKYDPYLRGRCSDDFGTETRGYNVNGQLTTLTGLGIYLLVPVFSEAEQALFRRCGDELAAPQSITSSSYSETISCNSWLGVVQTTGLNGEQLSTISDSYGPPIQGGVLCFICVNSCF